MASLEEIARTALDGDPLALRSLVQDWLGADGVCILSMQGNGAAEELHVAIQSRRKIEQTELIEIINALPKAFSRVIFHFVDALPRNEIGKVQRLVLKQKLFAGNV